jgi:hypothetical protein
VHSIRGSVQFLGRKDDWSARADELVVARWGSSCGGGSDPAGGRDCVRAVLSRMTGGDIVVPVQLKLQKSSEPTTNTIKAAHPSPQ